MFVVDAAQSVVLVPTFAVLLDALSVSTQKGLLGLLQDGFLYCRRWAERMQPTWPFRGGSGRAHRRPWRVRLPAAAGRGLTWNYNFVAATAANTSIVPPVGRCR
jgi:selenocysteine lyase/cysteine desulfurase